MPRIVMRSVYKTNDNAQHIYTYNEGTQMDKHNYKYHNVNTNNELLSLQIIVEVLTNTQS